MGRLVMHRLSCQFDWPMAIETHISYQLRSEKMKSLLPGHRYQTLFSWFRVQNKPYHCMIQYMVVVLAR